MSDILSLSERKHDVRGVLGDFEKSLEDYPAFGRDGAIVILIDRGESGAEFNYRLLSSQMRVTDIAGAFAAVEFELLRKWQEGRFSCK